MTISSVIYAVKTTTLQDSIKQKLKIGPAFDFDGRYSFINNKSVFIWGSRFGVFINDKFKVGVGGYFLNDLLKNQVLDSIGSQTYNEKRKLTFATCYFEPFIFRSKFWELSIPFEAGYGRANVKYYSITNDMLSHATTNIFIPLEAGLSASFKFPALTHFRPTGWLGLNGMIGYRYCVLDDIFKADYDGLFWSVSLTVLVDRISDDCHTWKEERSVRKKQ